MQNAPIFTDLHATCSPHVPLEKWKIGGITKKNGGANSIPLTGHTQNAPGGAPDMNQRQNRSYWEDVNDTVSLERLLVAHACKCQVMLSTVWFPLTRSERSGPERADEQGIKRVSGGGGKGFRCEISRT